MRITALILQAFIVGLIIGGFYGDVLGLGNSGTKSRTIETLEATVATQRETIAILQTRVRDADPPAIPFEFEAPE